MTSEQGTAARMARCLVVSMVVLVAGGCASQPPDASRQYLDERSAATVTVAPGSLVFARDRPELAVHARDYLTLVPVDVNRAGKHVMYFYGYIWSTIDKRRLPASDDRTGQFELVADGRRIPLVPVKAHPRELGLAERPVPAPSDSARLLISVTDRETLEFLAAAGEIRAVAQHDGISERYELWKDNRELLLAGL
jgi:hypothetical protein